MSLEHLKAGDEVFVVWQVGRHSRQEPRTETKKIVRVGRKFAYIESGAFRRDTGESHFFGFDVYASKFHYLKKVHDDQEQKRLQERLVDKWGKLKKLSPETVDQINKILDRAE